MLSRIYDIIINKRITSWYNPNPEQAGFRKKQGCIIQIFALFLTLEMSKCLNRSLFIGLLDFEKAFDFMNRPKLMKDLMKDGIGSLFLKNLFNMYSIIHYLPKTSRNLMHDDPIISKHGVTQGHNSYCNIFSYYISDSRKAMENLPYHEDFTNPENILQLADDTLILAEFINTLKLKFQALFDYSKDKYIVLNTDKTKFMHLSKNPTMETICINDTEIEAVDLNDGYVWLGFHLSYSSEITKLVQYNLKKKLSNIPKFYAWLNINRSTPFMLKMKVLYSCMFPSILYSCETWGDTTSYAKDLLLVEKKALKACLGIKSSTPDDIIYIELNRADIICHIHTRQYKFYRKFICLNEDDSSAKKILNKLKAIDNIRKPFLEYFENLTEVNLKENLQKKKNNIASSNKSMHTRYLQLFPSESNKVLYNSMVDDKKRAIISRWRLSSHSLYVETGRRVGLERSERRCIICNILEDENHALFICRAHTLIRRNHKLLLNEYKSVSEILSPRKTEDILEIANYILEIENNMIDLKMIR